MKIYPHGSLAQILGVKEDVLSNIPQKIVEKVLTENERAISATLKKLDSKQSSGLQSASRVRGILRKAIFYHESQFIRFLNTLPGKDEFERASYLAKTIAKVTKGFFLKKDIAKRILEQRSPKGLLAYLKLSNVKELLQKHDITEAFSALRFVESNEWMHETFDEIYSHFTPNDFEERDIELRVLGPEWFDIGQKFVAKKHHNVSHLKEFGVIFINPIRMDIPGKFLRDFALLLHYFHEIEFYSKLFRKYAREKNFADNLKSLLRGDVKEVTKVNKGEWLIVQRYLVKENPEDPRLLLPRVNPESLHWTRGERDFADFGLDHHDVDFELWCNLDWVGGLFSDHFGLELISFDLEDNAMSLVSVMEGKEEFFTYHQREALWTKVFLEIVGGESETERLLIENFNRGVIKV